MAFLFFLSSEKEIIMGMNKIAKGLGLCTIGFTGGMIFTGYQLGKLVKSDRVTYAVWLEDKGVWSTDEGEALRTIKKVIRKEISDRICKKVFSKQHDSEHEDINIIFDTFEEAKKISDQLIDIAGRYGNVTMADVYEACGFDVEDYQLHDIGWSTENFEICIKKRRLHWYNHEHPWDAYYMMFTKKPERMV